MLYAEYRRKFVRFVNSSTGLVAGLWKGTTTRESVCVEEKEKQVEEKK